MRILCLSEDTPFLAGGRLVFFKVCRALARKGHHVLALTGSGATETTLGPSEIEMRIHTPKIRILGSLLLMLKLLFQAVKQARSFDLIFVNAGIMVPVAVLAGFATHRRIVELHHDALSARELVVLARDPTRKLTAIIRWILNYLPLRFVSAIAAVSRYTADRLRQITGYQKLIEVIGNPVEE